MRTSSKGLSLIATYEGFRARPYKPVAGERYWTIGFGHYGPDVQPGVRWSRRTARRVLRQDVAAAERAVLELDLKLPATARLNQHQFDALVSLVFNAGPAAVMADTTIRRALERGEARRAADGFRLWVKGGSPLHVLEGLQRRRERERDLFLKPVPRRKARALDHTVAFDGVPVFRGHALMLADARTHNVKGVPHWTGHLNSADRRQGVAEKYGRMSQAALYVGWAARKAGFNPANPPGRSTHELRSDGVAYRGPVGRPLAWWQLGLDAGEAEELRGVLQALGYAVKRPYASGSEIHHTNCIRSPRRRLRKRKLR